jgi:hypothetical protein
MIFRIWLRSTKEADQKKFIEEFNEALYGKKEMYSLGNTAGEALGRIGVQFQLDYYPGCCGLKILSSPYSHPMLELSQVPYRTEDGGIAYHTSPSNQFTRRPVDIKPGHDPMQYFAIHEQEVYSFAEFKVAFNNILYEYSHGGILVADWAAMSNNLTSWVRAFVSSSKFAIRPYGQFHNHNTGRELGLWLIVRKGSARYLQGPEKLLTLVAPKAEPKTEEEKVDGVVASQAA